VGVPDKVVERRPIDVLQNDYPDVFNMLVLAFESIQKKDESHDLSYYQLSGIHGYPFTSWQYPPRNPGPQLGYCTHASSIFTTWHRPYVALLEQTLYEEAVSIAKRFTGPDASKYQAAAEDVRLPYWDWASDDTDSRLPKAVVEPSIAVVKPGSAGPTTIPNPLHSYHRRDIGEATVRGQSAEVDLMETFAERQLLTNALFTDTSYNDFSFNLEDIHNLVHVLIGGDMVDVARAAYDPVFWFHHCNVDRLMAMYQASHPDLYLSPGRRTPTYALDGPGTDDLSTPLYPFRHPDSREWTSDDVKTVGSIFKLGYAYPEVPPGRSGEDLKTFSIQKVNELYGPKTEDESFRGEFSGVPDQPNARREWNANVVVDSGELPGSQQIRLFIGDSGKNDTGSFATDDLAGVAAVFSSNLTSASSTSHLLNITVPLTQALIDKKVGLSPKDVVPKLASGLHWAVEQVGDTKTPVPVQDLKSLQISVTSQITDYPEDNTQLPVKSEPRTFLEPTDDKAGGLQSGQAPPVGRPANNGTASKLS
jgi:tyrosinase